MHLAASHYFTYIHLFLEVSTGIGSETTRTLVLYAVHIIMAVRNVVAANDVKEEIVKEIPTAKDDIISGSIFVCYTFLH